MSDKKEEATATSSVPIEAAAAPTASGAAELAAAAASSATQTLSGPVESLCMACSGPTLDFKPQKFLRRPVGPYDVLIDMKYCGVCHSDLHHAAGHNAAVGKVCYPCVPGHELAGVCIAIGPKVTKVKVGMRVGVGCMVDSCLNCKACEAGDEQQCKRMVSTYGSLDNGSGRAERHPLGGHTLGGYTNKFVVTERFTIIIPDSYPLECAGPVMCAGITMFNPMKAYGMGKGKSVGIIGLGGLGLMGVKIAKAIGCTVTAISRNASKEPMAKECGADIFLVSKDPAQMKAASESLDLVLNTVPVYHNYTAYNTLVKKTGKQVLLGLHAGFGGVIALNKITFNAGKLRTSMIGGIKNTQEIINLCAKHDIRPRVKIIPVQELNHAFELLDESNDAGLRYVLDIAGTLNADAASKCTAPPPKLKPASGNLTYTNILKQTACLFFGGHWL